jgi:hypothetical protein
MRNVVIAFAICYLTAIVFAAETDYFFVFTMSELLVTLIVAGLMYRIVPIALLKASRDNCFRVDGTLWGGCKAMKTTRMSKISDWAL